jgi:hypothetical protein
VILLYHVCCPRDWQFYTQEKVENRNKISQQVFFLERRLDACFEVIRPATMEFPSSYNSTKLTPS